MKKFVSFALAFLAAAVLLVGCGGSGSGGQKQTASPDSLKTVGDIIALRCEEQQIVYRDNVIVCAFNLNGTYYRATARIPQNVLDAIWELDFTNETYDEKRNALAAPLPIDEIENLNEQILTEDARDDLVGKTGRYLVDEGWYCSGYNPETMEFRMNYGAFMYTVTFDGEAAEEDYARFDEKEGIYDLTILSVEFLSLGDAANPE